MKPVRPKAWGDKPPSGDDRFLQFPGLPAGHGWVDVHLKRHAVKAWLEAEMKLWPALVTGITFPSPRLEDAGAPGDEACQAMDGTAERGARQAPDPITAASEDAESADQAQHVQSTTKRDYRLEDMKLAKEMRTLITSGAPTSPKIPTNPWAASALIVDNPRSRIAG